MFRRLFQATYIIATRQRLRGNIVLHHSKHSLIFHNVWCELFYCTFTWTPSAMAICRTSKLNIYYHANETIYCWQIIFRGNNCFFHPTHSLDQYSDRVDDMRDQLHNQIQLKLICLHCCWIRKKSIKSIGKNANNIGMLYKNIPLLRSNK